jgi:hypothetical protein|tara:strand:- start:1071 stop:1262 length:192 start_codon:yes stop_codon:yes gene_type:complete
MFSKFDTTVAVCENPAHCPTAADLAEYAKWCERQERDASRRRLMDHMDSLQQDQGDDLGLMGM